ncbi:Polyamine aminopropyltransferase 1 [Nymphon striatum]|nr:Polyamine aminopropyltransferase 1 [Nymphon striatum]
MSFPLVRALYETVMFSLIFIIGALVGMEIPFLTGILSYKQKMRDSIANQTPYQRIVVTESQGNNENRLFIDGHIQFSSRDEYRYHESLVHPLLSIPGNRSNVLVLGGGDGLAVREILKYDDVETIHLVDIDPEMTRISKELPILSKLNERSLEHEKLTVFNEDAFSFINRAGQSYDRIHITEAINKLYSKEFYTMIRKRMSPDGLLVSQSSSPFFTHKTFWSIEKTLDAVFKDTLSYHVSIPSFGIWGFNMASMGTSIPKSFQFNVDTRYIDKNTMQAAMIFGKDTQKVDVPVNSLMEPNRYFVLCCLVLSVSHSSAADTSVASQTPDSLAKETSSRLPNRPI